MSDEGNEQCDPIAKESDVSTQSSVSNSESDTNDTTRVLGEQLKEENENSSLVRPTSHID